MIMLTRKRKGRVRIQVCDCTTVAQSANNVLINGPIKSNLGSPLLGDKHVVAVQIAVLHPVFRKVSHPRSDILPTHNRKPQTDMRPWCWARKKQKKTRQEKKKNTGVPLSICLVKLLKKYMLGAVWNAIDLRKHHQSLDNVVP